MSLGRIALVCCAAGMLSFNLFAESVTGRLSDIAKGSYRTDLDYSGIVQDSSSDTMASFKGRFEVEYGGFSQKAPNGAYAKLFTKAANLEVPFKGANPKLPLFINESACPFLIKRLKEAKPGSKFFIYATMKRMRFSKNSNPAFVAGLQVDDVLTAEEEQSFVESKNKFQKGNANLAPVFPDQQKPGK